MKGPVKTPSALAQRMEMVVEHWAPCIPELRREEFREAFMRFAHDHDQALETIGNIWSHRDRAQAFDESTGLARRKPFLTHLASLLTSADGAAGAVCVLFLDLNGLKAINDQHGHAAGDRAITAASQLIRETIRVNRKEDLMVRSGDEDFAISRNGGDEFLIALELKTAEDITAVATRVKQHIDDPARQRAHGYSGDQPLSISVGAVACQLPVPDIPPDIIVRELVAAADSRMYASKRDGLVHIALGRFAARLIIDRELALASAPTPHADL